MLLTQGGFDAPGGQFGPLIPSESSAVHTGGMVISVLACKARRRDARYRNSGCGNHRGARVLTSTGANGSEIRYDYRRPSSQSPSQTKEGTARTFLDLNLAAPAFDPSTGELIVNRQMALIGTDVRVDNMAWNVKEESVVPTSLYESMVWSKERELNFVREDAPLLNLMRNVMVMVKAAENQTQSMGLVPTLRSALSSGDRWVKIGEVMRGSPAKGILHPVYNPADVAQKSRQSGAIAVSARVDQT
jgi:hypothetical protein